MMSLTSNTFRAGIQVRARMIGIIGIIILIAREIILMTRMMAQICKILSVFCIFGISS